MSIDKNRIIAYLSDELSVEEKNSFEYEIKNNNELKLFLNELETNDLQLQSLIKHKTSSNFILNLNKRIDLFEEGTIPWYKTIVEKFSYFNVLPRLGTLSIFFLVSFAIYKIGFNSSLSTYILGDNNTYDEDIVAVNDDSLSIDSDSLKKSSPTLLISKDK